MNKVPLNPPMIKLGKVLGWQPLPLTIDEAREWALQSEEKLKKVTKRTSLKRLPSDRKIGTAFIQATGVRVNFGGIQALRGVELSLYPGEIAVMMGPNGAGKSTLLRSFIGLTPIQNGTIQVGGKEIAGRSVADICQQVGYLPQDPNALLFADTVEEELLITLRNHHLDRSKINPSLSLLLDSLGLGDKSDCYPRDLSTGERQRVALGAVMVTHPSALLLDEPTRGLDYEAKQTLLHLLINWRDEGMVILMVTHDVELAVQAADRIILLENGLVSGDGLPKEVLANSTIFAPQMAKIFPNRGWLTVNDAIGEVDASQY
jgi:energy-coupling factor transporter ATP-binding protein EcfA2